MVRSTRKAHSGRRRTRRADPKLTVEGLHASFGKIDSRARALVSQGATDGELGKGIYRTWSEQFQTTLSPSAVRGLVAHYRAVFKGEGKNKTRKARGQRGGMAPMDWIMGPGTTAAYGRFPLEMGASPSALSTMDRFYENKITRACDSTGGYNAPGGLKGGGVIDSIMNGFAPASVPRNFIETTNSAIQGRTIANPPADPVTSRVPSAVFEPAPYNPQTLTQISSMAPIYQPM